MYSAFYGLKQEPFRLSPDPRFLHLAEPHRNTLRALVEGVAGRKGLQVSVGPIGTGKTTLLYCLQRILANEAHPDRPVRSAFVMNPVLSRDELFEMLFDELEIACGGSSKPARLRALHELLLDSHSRNGAVVLIIDEAHLLTLALFEEVRLLLNLDNYHVNVLQVILCGQPELAPLLAKPELAALKQRVAVLSKLRPLSLVECRAYIAERLHVAGLPESPFNTPALEAIYRLTHGVPRLINSLCDRALMVGFRRQSKKIAADFITEAADELSLAELDVDPLERALEKPAVSAASMPSGTKI
jgi:general secretion pathway protein A